MTEDEVKAAFMADLSALLTKHGAELEAKDHWTGYAECGSDVRMTATISSIYAMGTGECIRPFVEIDLGSWLTGDS